MASIEVKLSATLRETLPRVDAESVCRDRHVLRRDRHALRRDRHVLQCPPSNIALITNRFRAYPGAHARSRQTLDCPEADGGDTRDGGDQLGKPRPHTARGERPCHRVHLGGSKSGKLLALRDAQAAISAAALTAVAVRPPRGRKGGPRAVRGDSRRGVLARLRAVRTGRARAATMIEGPAGAAGMEGRRGKGGAFIFWPFSAVGDGRLYRVRGVADSDLTLCWAARPWTLYCRASAAAWRLTV